MKKDKSFIIVGGILAVLLWFIFFGLGLFINSKPFRDTLMNGLDWYSFFICLITYTPTNIAFLCMASAFCGGCSNNLIIGKKVNQNNTANEEPTADLPQNPFNCMIRGFVVYVAFLAGVYVLINAPFAQPTQEEYAKAAGVVSLLAYAVGYDQSNFLNLLNLSSKLKKKA